MTKVKILKDENEQEIEVKGHSNYKESGSDIVCSSISTACIMTANLIDKLGYGYNIIKLVCDDGYFRLVIKNDNEIVNNVFENLVDTLKSLETQYPKNIKIEN